MNTYFKPITLPHTCAWMAWENPLTGRVYDRCAWPFCERSRMHRVDALHPSALVLAHFHGETLRILHEAALVNARVYSIHTEASR